MFKLLTEIFKKEDLLHQAYNTSIDMLRTDKDMYTMAYKSLAHEVVEDELDVYSMDQKINEFQRDVRRKVVVYLATSAARDIVFGLMLVSIIIDIERIGDYAKNIMDLAKNHPEPLDYYMYSEKIKHLEKDVHERFEKLIKAFEESDDHIAVSIMEKHKTCNEACDSIITDLSRNNTNEIPSGEAVTLALYVRYLKRISAHITNVASGMVNTFDNIGFKSN